MAARVSAAPASATTDHSPGGGLEPPGESSAPTAQGTRKPSPDPGTVCGASAPWPPLSFRSSPHPAPGKVASACSALGPRGFKKKRTSATRLTFLGHNERAKAPAVPDAKVMAPLRRARCSRRLPHTGRGNPVSAPGRGGRPSEAGSPPTPLSAARVPHTARSAHSALARRQPRRRVRAGGGKGDAGVRRGLPGS